MKEEERPSYERLVRQALWRFSPRVKTIFDLGAGNGFTFRKCLWLCIPALIVGAVIRISLLTAIPEAFYGADSNSYFVTARDMRLEHKFTFGPKRRYLYPLALIAAPSVPFCTTVQAVAIAQHTAGLIMIVGIGWVTGNLVRRPVLWVPLVTLFSACWPRILIYEHEMLGECMMLCTFVATACIAAPPGGLATTRRLGWYLILAVIIVAVKPAGRPIWGGLFLAAMLITRNPLAWPKKFYLTAVAAIAIALTSGGDGQGPGLLMSSTLPFIKPEGEPYAKERAMIRPYIEETRADLPNFPFNQKVYKKILNNSRPEGELGPEYAKFVQDKKRFSKVAMGLGIPAILSHPFAYTKLVGLKILAAASSRHHDQRLVPETFWEDQDDSSEGRWDRRPEEMKLLYDLDEAGYEAMAEERAKRTVWYAPYMPLVKSINWVYAEGGEAGEKPTIEVKWMGWLLLLGLVGCLMPGRFRRTSIIWLPLVVYLPVVYGVGDRVSRYLHTVDWLGFVMIVIGLDVVLDVVTALWKRVRSVRNDDRQEIAPASV